MNRSAGMVGANVLVVSMPTPRINACSNVPSQVPSPTKLRL
jgi:hypothetical protein